MFTSTSHNRNCPIGTIGGSLIRDGSILHVDRMADQIEVTVEVTTRRRSLAHNDATSVFSVVFDDVTSVSMLHPKGMLFSSILEWEIDAPLRCFEFANQFQPGDDWDPHLAESRLEIVASQVSIHEPH